jgi:putative sporulation protein YtaF
MELFVMVMFALAVSADGFMVGLSYGLNKIRIPVLSLIVIAFASCLAVTTSMLIGQGLMTYLQPHGAANIGALVVIAVGIYFLLNAFREKINRLIFSLKALSRKSTGWKLMIKSLLSLFPYAFWAS